MTLLAPLGLLGLLSIAVLIIIYILRPNYQQKTVSSTYVWKLSLKYRKKRLPTSKLRNILLILCQVLILASCAAILAKPARVLKTKVDQTEVIAILDASASMRAESDGETRFGRALEKIQTLADETHKKDGVVSVILAEDTASFLAQRIDAENRDGVASALEPYFTGEKTSSYGAANVDAAFELCEEVLLENPSAKIYFYTDTEYGYVPEGITVENLADEKEWNVSILDASTEILNNYYTFNVDVAYYGADVTKAVTLTLNVSNANSEDESGGRSVILQHSFTFSGAGEKTIVFITDISYAELYEGVDAVETEEGVEYVILGDGQRIYSYEAAYINTDSTTDSFSLDNSFNLFNGQKPIIKVQYASGNANPFFRGALLTLQSSYANQLDIRITEVKQKEQPATEGFDFYLFEHIMPEALPSDGVAMLVNPDIAPEGAGFRINRLNVKLRESMSLTAETNHKLLNHVNPDNIKISQYTTITGVEASYETLMTCDNDPVFLVRDESDRKTVLMNFSIHYSNLPILLDFPLLMRNIFEYFFPVTVADYAFEVYESVELNARGSELTVKFGDSELYKFTSFPATLKMDEPGNYILTQNNPFTGAEIREYVYVKTPSAESNIFASGAALKDPYRTESESDYFKDLLLYLASALVALLFIEWWLQSRETM